MPPASWACSHAPAPLASRRGPRHDPSREPIPPGSTEWRGPPSRSQGRGEARPHFPPPAVSCTCISTAWPPRTSPPSSSGAARTSPEMTGPVGSPRPMRGTVRRRGLPSRAGKARPRSPLPLTPATDGPIVLHAGLVPRPPPGRPAARRLAVHHHMTRAVLPLGRRWRAVTRHPAHDDPPRSPLVPVLAALRITPPARTLHPHDTIRTRARMAGTSGRRRYAHPQTPVLRAALVHVPAGVLERLAAPRADHPSSTLARW